MITESRLEGIRDELAAREPIFHRPELGVSRAELEAQTAPDFWEVGASGKQYTRDFVLDTVERRYTDPDWNDLTWETRDFHCREVGAETYLLTYTLLESGRLLTRRATLWRRKLGGWEILYHQGTVVRSEDA